MKIFDIAYQDVAWIDKGWIKSAVASPDALMVSPEESAASVAQKVDALGTHYVILVDPFANGEVRGVVIPNWVRSQVQRVLGQSSGSLAEAAAVIERNPSYGGRFGHEWLNFDRPQPYWCVEGKHFIAEPPCAEHSKKTTGP